MPSEPKAAEVFLTPRFQRDLRTLAKRYRHIRSDLQPLLEQLQAGEVPGDQIMGVGLTLYKVRLSNRDMQRGKRGGYRVVYYLKTSAQVILVTMYSKSDIADVDSSTLREAIAEFDSKDVDS